MSDKGPAFVKGGFGCLLTFFAIGLIFVLLGGSMHINLGGAILLFVIGVVVGLVAMPSLWRKSGPSNGQGVAFASGRTLDLDLR